MPGIVRKGNRALDSMSADTRPVCDVQLRSVNNFTNRLASRKTRCFDWVLNPPALRPVPFANQG